jgi:putative transposase
MIATKCFKYRLEPTKEQEETLLRFAGCRRFVWNWGLARKQEVYKSTGKSIGYNALAAELVALKKQAETAFLKECHSQVLQQTLMDLQKRSRLPRFKSRKRCFPAFRIPQNVSVVDDKVSIPKVGMVKGRFHRSLEGTVKSATAKQEMDGHWYVVFVSHIELPDIVSTGENPVGIDVGLTCFLTLDSGEKVEPPKFYRLAYRFGQVVKVGRFYASSKTCHDCGNVQHLELSDREWMCTGCGVIQDRDTNAAKNILSEGLRRLALGTRDRLNADGGNVRLATASSSR